MNFKYIVFLLFLIPLNNLKAVDRIVQENGPSGTYASITQAVDSASDGDRIIIINRPGNLPWQEDVTISKSLTILPAVDGTRFLAMGDYILNPSTAGKHIRIVGMENLDGDVISTSIPPAGIRTKIEVVGCDISGGIVLERNYLDVLVASNTISGHIGIWFGNVYGNDVVNGIYIGTDNSPSNDVISIIGNKAPLISWFSNAQYFWIANNNLFLDGNVSGATILIGNAKDSAAKLNVIENNSIQIYPQNCCIYTLNAILFSSFSAPSAQIEVVNNALAETNNNTSYGIRVVSTTTNIFANYNHISSTFATDFSGVVNNGTNVTNLNVSISATGLPTGPGIADGGHPSTVYTDHDLSRNDPGCFGGSFNINNYFPQSISSGPRVFHVGTPRALHQGTNLNVTAEGFDR